MNVTGIMGGARQAAMSLSPVIHNAGFKSLGLDWMYVRFPVRRGEASTAVARLAAAGIRGFNVTYPHKEHVLRALDDVAGVAREVEAVNTIAINDGKIVGWNTDVPGLKAFLREDAGWEPAGAAVVLGSGGAARAAVSALTGDGLDSIALIARSRSKGESLKSLAGATRFESGDFASSSGLIEGAGLLVNATPLGQLGEKIELDLALLSPGALVVDLVYQPLITPLIARAKELGLKTYNGLGMLIRQASFAFEIWTGLPAPLQAMDASLKRFTYPAD